MIRILKNIEFKYFPIIALIAYVPFHLLEEALNNFPYWILDNSNYHDFVDRELFGTGVSNSRLMLFEEDKQM